MIRNLIRTVAVALIIFPEPATTVLGMVILSATFAMPRRRSLRKFGDLDGLLKKSLVDPQASGFNRCISLPWPAPILDNRRVDEKVLHHTLKTSFAQYQARPALVRRPS